MISPILNRFVLFVLAAAVAPLGHSQYLQLGNQLTGSGALTNSPTQGSAVAVSRDGNTAVVGASSDNAFWVFNRTNGAWAQQGGRLSGTGGSATAGQGFSVAISADGNTVIVGAPFDSNSVGASWVFVRTNGTWNQQAKLTGSDSVGASQQGYSVALSGDGNTALVGGALDGGGLGATWVYTRNGNGVWSQQGAKLIGTGSVGGSWQGNGVALSADGNTAITGGPFDANFLGATWVFTRNGNGVWSQQGQKLVGTGALGGPYQGQSVSLSADGNTALIGGPFDNLYQIGAAWVFTRNAGGNWSQQGSKLVASDPILFPAFGQSVSLSSDGNTAVLGGPNDNNGAGAAWIFTYTNGAWIQQPGKLIGSGTVGTAGQGQSVSISGDGTTVFVGGPRDNASKGAAWVFEQIHMTVSAPANATAGVPLNFSVNLLQPDNTPFSGSTGLVHFTSSDPAATLPADTTVTNGMVFAATFRNAGNQTITIVDTTRLQLNAQSAAIAVGGTAPAAATHFSVTAPAAATRGVAVNSITVTALDATNQTATAYAGTVHFTSTDGAATLPANATLTNGTGTFSVTFNTAGNQTVTATHTANAGITGTSNAVAVGNAGVAPPTPIGVVTAGGSTTFAFNDPRGAQDLGVVNILINRVLDGRNACYLAYSQPLNVLYLLDDNGVISPQIPGAVLNAAGSAANSQCTVAWDANPVLRSANGLAIAITLNLTFKPAFGGNKVIYMAARDIAENNSGWQALGVVQAPGALQATTTSAVGMTNSRGFGLGPTHYIFTFSDTRGFADLGVMNVLINDSIDGRHGCYLAYSRPLNTLYLVNDNGDGLLPGVSLDTTAVTSNSQCTVSGDVGSVERAGNVLTLALNIQFKPAFAGNRIFFLAARDTAEGNNTDWQPLGTWTVQ